MFYLLYFNSNFVSYLYKTNSCNDSHFLGFIYNLALLHSDLLHWICKFDVGCGAGNILHVL